MLNRLTQESLAPSPEADRATLIRRLSFDLWGLPPSPSAVESFQRDTSPQAYERLVDALLDGPEYGEHWARHWLDLVRYADSDGYRVDDYRPHAWRYRDYVIRSLNQDKPYDRFVQEQLAGDELWPDEPDALIATGFLRHGIYEYNNRDAEAQWGTLLNDITDTTAEVFLGLGLQCARCHDHKFDPISQQDYFRFQAFFAALLPEDETPVIPPAERAAHLAKRQLWEEKTADLREQIRLIEEPYRRAASDELRSKFPIETQDLMRKPMGERTPYEHQIAELAYRQITHAYERLAPRVKPADKERLNQLRKQLATFDELLPPPLPVAMTARDVGRTAPPTRIPKRADTAIEPGYLSALKETLRDQPTSLPPPTERSTGRRTALARWITHPHHPLTARVLVNRVWQYHLGRGLVATSSDFGKLGEPPSHPELLDWLATEFVATGWSLKKLHRLIVTSATYRQSTAPVEQAGKDVAGPTGGIAATPGAHSTEADRWKRGLLIDPDNRLLWHGQAKRLTAEQIRDALLQSSAELKSGSPGPSVDGSKFHRSVYSKVLRNTRDPLLDAFDAPQNFSSTCQRDATTTPMQSLLLLNSGFMLERARLIAARIDQRFPAEPSDQVRAAYQALLGRAPTPTESQEALGFLQAQAHRVDSELATAAAAAFATAKMPYRDGRAALIQARADKEVLRARLETPLRASPFTLEVFVHQRSLSEDGSPRTIVAGQAGDPLTPVWNLAIAGHKGQPKPQTLFLEITNSATREVTVAASDLSIRPDRPYFVAVVLDAAQQSAQFHVKDLSNDDEPLASATVPLPGNWGAVAVTSLTVGAKPGGLHCWDGLLDDLRISLAELPRSEWLLNRSEASNSTVAFWPFELKPGPLFDRSGRGQNLSWKPAVQTADRLPTSTSPARLALADLCHVLINSSEFLYAE